MSDTEDEPDDLDVTDEPQTDDEEELEVKEMVDVDAEEDEDDEDNDEPQQAASDNKSIECIREGEQKYITERIVADANRKTSDRISAAEFTSLIGVRAQLLNKGEQPYIQTSHISIENQTAEYIATQELIQSKFMLLLVRKMGNGEVEVWDPNRMNLEKCPIAHLEH